MPKGRRPAVEPSVCREWLRLSEEENLSAPRIAERYGYDARTVRNALEWARDDRERREARIMVFRDAVAGHYEDLITFVKKLETEIQKDLVVSSLTREERMWNALKQHLPRSRFWKLVKQLDEINLNFKSVADKLKQCIADLVAHESTPEVPEGAVNRGAVEGAALNWAVASHDEGARGIEASQYSPGRKTIHYGTWNCAIVPEEITESVVRYLTSLMDKVAELPEAQHYQGSISKRATVMYDMLEELATIRLKRVIPGRCKYCPM